MRYYLNVILDEFRDVHSTLARFLHILGFRDTLSLHSRACRRTVYGKAEWRQSAWSCQTANVSLIELRKKYSRYLLPNGIGDFACFAGKIAYAVRLPLAL